MRNMLYIMGKELRSYFVTPMAYIVTAFWMFVTGGLFAASLASRRADMLLVFAWIVILLLLLIPPVLTMRLIAEESRMGTLELLLTSPVQDWAVVLGKYFAALVLYLSMVALTLFYPLLLILFGGKADLGSNITAIDWGPIWSGYLGLILIGMTYLAIGLFASALTSNQMITALISVVILLMFLFLYIFDQLITPFVGEGSGFARLLDNLSIISRFLNTFAEGKIDVKEILFYLIFTGVVLFITTQIVEARRYRA